MRFVGPRLGGAGGMGGRAGERCGEGRGRAGRVAVARAELDLLDGLEARLGGPDFEVVAVSMDMNGPGGVARFYEKHGIRRLGVYADPNYAASRVLGARGIPTTLLIDKEGREVG